MPTIRARIYDANPADSVAVSCRCRCSRGWFGYHDARAIGRAVAAADAMAGRIAIRGYCFCFDDRMAQRIRLSLRWPQLHSVLFASTDNPWLHLLRYLCVGAMAFSIDFATLYLLVEWGHLHYLVAATIGFIFGSVISYTMSVYWVFAYRRIASRRTEMMIFFLIGVGGLLANNAVIWFFTEMAQFHYMQSKIFAAVLIFLWNFLARRTLLFS